MPDDAGARYLIEDGTSPADVTDAIGAYTPDEFPRVRRCKRCCKRRSIRRQHANPVASTRQLCCLLTADNWLTQLDYDTLLASAESSQAVIFSAILGSIASDSEVANVTNLTAPTAAPMLTCRVQTA